MTNNAFIVAGGYSIAIAAVIGLIRLPRLYVAYQPFIFITIFSFLSEVASHLLIIYRKSNAVALNLFGLLDALLWLWQFRRWNRHPSRQMMFHVAAMSLLVLWLIENIALGKLFIFASVYPIVFSLLMVILSAIEAGRQIVVEKHSLFTTPKFMICCAAILFYSYRILIESFYAPHVWENEILLGNVFTILSVVNFIVNLFYALAVLWIPEKHKFSLPYY